LPAKEANGRRLNELRARLTAAARCELEKLLVDRISVTWPKVYHADVDLTQHLLASPGAPPAGEAAQKRLDAAHRRFLTSVKTLAPVQKLVRPAPPPFEFLKRPDWLSSPLLLTAYTCAMPPSTNNSVPVM
jgi:hypothetical protein